MPNEDNACIRYLMKELDPSEEVLIERSMMEDEDLLIEVECMRQTLNRLNKGLPLIDPPPHLTNQILNKAAQRKNSLKPRVFPSGYHFAAAAVVLIGLVSGLLWIQTDSTETEARSSALITSSPAFTFTPVLQNDLEPWIDRNEIIRFQDQFSSENQAAFDSILNTSTQKLKLIKDPMPVDPQSRSLQLTGSER